jgi:hypothetical protein
VESGWSWAKEAALVQMWETELKKRGVGILWLCLGSGMGLCLGLG